MVIWSRSTPIGELLLLVNNMEKDLQDLFKYFDEIYFSFEGGRACYLYTSYNLFINYSRPPETKRWPLPQTFGLVGDSKAHQVQWIWFLKDPKDFETFFCQFLKKPQELKVLEKMTTKLRVEAMRRLKAINPEHISTKDLIKEFHFFNEQFAALGYHAVVLRFIDRGIIAYCSKQYSAEAHDIIHTISLPTRPGFAYQEESAILALAAKMLKKNISIDSKYVQKYLQKIHDAYAWIICGYYNEKPKTIETYRHALSEALHNNPQEKINERLASTKMILKEQKALLASHPDDLKPLARIAGEAAYLKDYFKFSVNAITYFAEPLFGEISRRSGLAIEVIKDMLPSEIEKVLEGGVVDLDYVKKRAERHVLISYTGHIFPLAGEEAELFAARYLVPAESGNEKEYTGRPASKGKATGRAVIVLSSDDFHKIKENDIIVVTNTSPDYVPILGKVAGIIAEEGGITAHVSVISREMKIPAVVGLLGITKRLKDGDTVSLDGFTGLVKIG